MMKNGHMKAVVFQKYGPPEVLQIRDVEKPTPGEHEVQVKVHATTVTSGDNRIRQADPFLVRMFFGLLRPKIATLGSELAGEIAATGNGVALFKVGDQVFGYSNANYGAHAEYVCLTESGAVAGKPANMSYAEAAAVPFGATTALYFLRNRGNIKNGEKVLIYGASGSVGTAAVQLAKHFGAEVTGVCSTANVELVKSLGADAVIDYKKEDFTAGGERFDIIFDAVGKISSQWRNALAPGGRFVTIKKGMASGNKDDLLFLKALIEAGGLKPVVDRLYPMEQIVEAHRYVDQGHKKGSVVVTVDHRRN
jgi:NADPH:quinone reductase-like Zn-dependent oxidoreductase